MRAPEVDEILVPELNADDAIKLLISRSGDDDIEAAQIVASAVGYLPLALEQAGAYCKVSGLSLAEYADKLFDQMGRTLDIKPPGSGHRYPSSVVSAVLLSLSRLDEVSSSALRLLGWLAYLAPTPIVIQHLKAFAELTDEPQNRRIVSDLDIDLELGLGVANSLLRRDGPTVEVHPLVQLVARDAMTLDEQLRMNAAAVDLVRMGFETAGRDRTVIADLIPHAIQAALHCLSIGLLHKPAFELLMAVGAISLDVSDFKLAKWAFERALPFAIGGFGIGHPETGAVLDRIATACHRLGDFNEARRRFGEAEEVARRSNSASLLAQVLGNTGLLLDEMGEHDSAKRYSDEALTTTEEENFGASRPRLQFPLYVNRCRDRLDVQDFEAARAALRQAELCLQQISEPSVADQAYLKRTKAELEFQTNNPDTAMPIMPSALKELEDEYGTESVEAARIKNDLVAHSLHPDLPSAMKTMLIEMQRQVLDAYEGHFDEDHLEIARAMNQLGEAYRHNGELSKAEAMHLRALDIKNKRLDCKHYSVSVSEFNLAQTYRDAGMRAKAQRYARRSYRSRRDTLGREHRHTMQARRLLDELEEKLPRG